MTVPYFEPYLSLSMAGHHWRKNHRWHFSLARSLVRCPTTWHSCAPRHDTMRALRDKFCCASRKTPPQHTTSISHTCTHMQTAHGRVRFHTKTQSARGDRDTYERPNNNHRTNDKCREGGRRRQESFFAGYSADDRQPNNRRQIIIVSVVIATTPTAFREQSSRVIVQVQYFVLVSVQCPAVDNPLIMEKFETSKSTCWGIDSFWINIRPSNANIRMNIWGSNFNH